VSINPQASTPDGADARVRVAGNAAALRDYFLRLGADAVIAADGTLEIALAVNDDATVERYLSTWASTNQIPARIEGPLGQATVSQLFGRRPRLGDLLLDKGLIAESELRTALVESAQTGDRLGRVLVRRELIFEDELARMLAEQLALPYVSLRAVGVDSTVAELLPIETGLHFAAIPIARLNGKVRVAFADPFDSGALAAVAEHIPAYAPVVAELSEIELAWRTVAPEAAA
jgi:hypothetical protein